MEIEGYNNYLIYPDGKVSSKRFPNRYLKPLKDGGYSRVFLCGDRFLIHRLVALHYIPNPDNKRCVDHINGNKSDNRIENLRWATHSENSQNRGAGKNNKLGIKNICYDPKINKYQYTKQVKGIIHTKKFKTLEDTIKYKKEYENDIKVSH